jgi:hypothetical protein
LFLLPRAAEGAEPDPRRGGWIVIEGVVLRRGRWRRPGGNGRAGGRASEAGGLQRRRRARVQVPVRAGGPRARGHCRCRRSGVRAQAAPGDRPQHRQNRQELPAGEGVTHLNLARQLVKIKPGRNWRGRSVLLVLNRSAY